MYVSGKGKLQFFPHHDDSRTGSEEPSSRSATPQTGIGTPADEQSLRSRATSLSPESETEKSSDEAKRFSSKPKKERKHRQYRKRAASPSPEPEEKRPSVKMTRKRKSSGKRPESKRARVSPEPVIEKAEPQVNPRILKTVLDTWETCGKLMKENRFKEARTRLSNLRRELPGWHPRTPKWGNNKHFTGENLEKLLDLDEWADGLLFSASFHGQLESMARWGAELPERGSRKGKELDPEDFRNAVTFVHGYLLNDQFDMDSELLDKQRVKEAERHLAWIRDSKKLPRGMQGLWLDSYTMLCRKKAKLGMVSEKPEARNAEEFMLDTINKMQGTDDEKEGLRYLKEAFEACFDSRFGLGFQLALAACTRCFSVRFVYSKSQEERSRLAQDMANKFFYPVTLLLFGASELKPHQWCGTYDNLGCFGIPIEKYPDIWAEVLSELLDLREGYGSYDQQSLERHLAQSCGVVLSSSYLKALRCLSQEKFSKARDHLEGVLSSHDSADEEDAVNLLMAFSYIKESRFENAEDYLQEMQETRPSQAGLQKIRLYQAMGKTGQASELIRKGMPLAGSVLHTAYKDSRRDLESPPSESETHSPEGCLSPVRVTQSPPDSEGSTEAVIHSGDVVPDVTEQTDPDDQAMMTSTTTFIEEVERAEEKIDFEASGQGAFVAPPLPGESEYVPPPPLPPEPETAMETEVPPTPASESAAGKEISAKPEVHATDEDTVSMPKVVLTETSATKGTAGSLDAARELEAAIKSLKEMTGKYNYWKAENTKTLASLRNKIHENKELQKNMGQVKNEAEQWVAEILQTAASREQELQVLLQAKEDQIKWATQFQGDPRLNKERLLGEREDFKKTLVEEQRAHVIALESLERELEGAESARQEIEERYEDLFRSWRDLAVDKAVGDLYRLQAREVSGELAELLQAQSVLESDKEKLLSGIRTLHDTAESFITENQKLQVKLAHEKALAQQEEASQEASQEAIAALKEQHKTAFEALRAEEKELRSDQKQHLEAAHEKELKKKDQTFQQQLQAFREKHSEILEQIQITQKGLWGQIQAYQSEDVRQELAAAREKLVQEEAMRVKAEGRLATLEPEFESVRAERDKAISRAEQAEMSLSTSETVYEIAGRERPGSNIRDVALEVMKEKNRRDEELEAELSGLRSRMVEKEKQYLSELEQQTQGYNKILAETADRLANEYKNKEAAAVVRERETLEAGFRSQLKGIHDKYQKQVDDSRAIADAEKAQRLAAESENKKLTDEVKRLQDLIGIVRSQMAAKAVPAVVRTVPVSSTPVMTARLSRPTVPLYSSAGSSSQSAPFSERQGRAARQGANWQASGASGSRQIVSGRASGPVAPFVGSGTPFFQQQQQQQQVLTTPLTQPAMFPSVVPAGTSTAPTTRATGTPTTRTLRDEGLSSFLDKFYGHNE